MKKTLKFAFLAIAIAVTTAACESTKSTNGTDTTKTDSTVAVDSNKKDTTTAAPADTTKKDSVKK